MSQNCKKVNKQQRSRLQADVFFYEDSRSFDSIITELSNLSAASDEAARQEDASPASAPAKSVLSLATLRSRDYEFPHHRRYYLFRKLTLCGQPFFCRVIYCDRKSNKAKTSICGTVARSSSVVILSIVQIKQRSDQVP